MKKLPHTPPLMSPEAKPDPYAAEASEPQLDDKQEVHALFAVDIVLGPWLAHANFVGVPPLPLLELHAAEEEAAHARASAARLRNPIMKGPPE